MLPLILLLNISSYILDSFSFKDVFMNLMYMGILSTCRDRGIGPYGATFIDGCDLPCEHWELNSGQLEGQPVLLITEPSLWPWDSFSLLLFTNCDHLVKRKPSLLFNPGFLSISRIFSWTTHFSSLGLMFPYVQDRIANYHILMP